VEISAQIKLEIQAAEVVRKWRSSNRQVEGAGDWRIDSAQDIRVERNENYWKSVAPVGKKSLTETRRRRNSSVLRWFEKNCGNCRSVAGGPDYGVRIACALVDSSLRPLTYQSLTGMREICPVLPDCNRDLSGSLERGDGEKREAPFRPAHLRAFDQPPTTTIDINLYAELGDGHQWLRASKNTYPVS
jgi:hypothetical protein